MNIAKLEEGGVHASASVLTQTEKKKEGKPSELMDLLIARDWKSLFNIPDVREASIA